MAFFLTGSMLVPQWRPLARLLLGMGRVCSAVSRETLHKWKEKKRKWRQSKLLK